MSLYTQNKNVICGLGMSYADFDHQLIWGDFYFQIRKMYYYYNFVIIQEPETKTETSYRLPDISILNDLISRKTLICIEISNEKNLNYAKKQQDEIIIKNPYIKECFIYDYDNNKWYRRKNKNYTNNSKSDFLNYDFKNLYLNSKYKNYIDNHVKEFAEQKKNANDNLAGLF